MSECVCGCVSEQFTYHDLNGYTVAAFHTVVQIAGQHNWNYVGTSILSDNGDVERAAGYLGL